MDALTLTGPSEPMVRAGTTALLRVDRLNDDDWGAWDRFVSVSGGGSFFHTKAWIASVQEAFGHRCVCLTARRGDEIIGGLPVVEVRSFLAGRMLVSMPYGVYGGVVGEDQTATRLLLDEAAGLATELKARCVELRSKRAVWAGVPVVDRYVTFRKELPGSADECLGALPRKARAAVRAARDKHELSVSVNDSHLPAVWRLYCNGMRRLGSLNYPYRFFESLVRLTPGRHFVSLVSYNGRPIAGLVTFLFGGVAMPYFVGADARFARLNVYNFIYLTAMEYAVTMGCHAFDFGRSRRDNHGACAFKKNQGFDPQPLEYQVYALPGHAAPNLTPSNPKFAAARKIWPVLPGLVTRPLGAWLSRHIPG